MRSLTPPLADIPETRVEEATPLKDAPKNIEDSKTEEPLDGAKDKLTVADSPRNSLDDVDLDDDEEEEEDQEDVVIHEVHQAAAPQVVTRARVVQVAKPIPPKLPTRNPFRNRQSANSDTSLDTPRDASAGASSAEKHSPDSTPSLMRADSTSSLSSVDKLDHIGSKSQSKQSSETVPVREKKEEKEDLFHSLPESPIKAVPGGFH